MARLWLPGDSDFAPAIREPNLLVPGRKPVGLVQIDWRNPLASSLTAVALPELGGVGEYTKNGFELAEFYGTGFKVRPEPGGIALSSDTTTNSSVRLEHVTSSSHVSPWTPSTGVTAVIVSARNGTQGGNCPLFGASAPSTSPYFGWGFYLSGSSDDVTFMVQTTSGYDGSAQVTESTTWPSGVVRVHVGTWDGATIRLYRNGVQQGSTAKSGASIYYPSGFDIGVSLGSFYYYGGGPRGFVGDIYIAMVFDRALSAAEVAEISRNPYQILKPANSAPFLIGLPGGGGAVEITVPQGNLILSAAAPTVSVTASASIDVPQADLVLSTTAPTVSVSDHVDITVPHADLTLSTTAPTVQVSANVSIEVPQADLSLSSEPPAVTTTDHVEISPPAADLSLSSVAPTIAVSEDGAIIVPTAQLLLSTQAPTVELSNNIDITVPQGDLSLSTTAPKVGISWNIEVPQGTLSLSSTAPSVLQGFNILVPGANLTLSPTAPVVATTAAVGITVPQGDLVLEGFAPTVEATGVDIWTQVGAASTSWTEVTSSSTVWTEI